MLTERDQKILEFAKENSITINQAHKIFWSKSKFGHDLARKRLQILKESNLLKCYTNFTTSEYVYYVDKKASPHAVYLNDFYAELIYSGAEIVEFNKEVQFDNVRPDALVRFYYKDYEVIYFIEVDLTHKTDIKKYEELKAAGTIQKKYGLFPAIVIIDSNPREIKGSNLKIINIDYKLNDFVLKVIP